MRLTRTKVILLTFFSFIVLVLFVLPQAIFGADTRRAERESRIPGQYIVVLKDSVADASAVETDIISKVHGQRLDSYRSALQGFSAQFSDADVASVASDPRVAFVSQDHTISIADGIRPSSYDRSRSDSRWPETPPPPPPTPAPPPTPSPPPTPPPSPSPSPAPAPSTDAAKAQSTTQIIPTGVSRIGAAGKVNRGAGVDVAVIDTGIYTSHADLQGKVVGGKNCTNSSGGYIDQNGHGTHVAGTIAALDNSFGVVGVAPDARLWSVRVLDRNGSGTWSTVICGIDFVTSKAPKNGGTIKVANMSLGGSGFSDNNCGNSNSDALHKAICRARDAGVTFVVAAGNSGANAASFVPAAYSDAVITVSALADSNGTAGGGGPSTPYGADDTFATFSNWGAPVDIGAPGVNILSTWIYNQYATLSGTSMASPHVAGAAALYIETHPNAQWNEVRDALINLGEGNGAGHTDPSGLHPEKVLNVNAL